jgi:hypothetical protein
MDIENICFKSDTYQNTFIYLTVISRFIRGFSLRNIYHMKTINFFCYISIDPQMCKRQFIYNISWYLWKCAFKCLEFSLNCSTATSAEVKRSMSFVSATSSTQRQDCNMTPNHATYLLSCIILLPEIFFPPIYLIRILFMCTPQRYGIQPHLTIPTSSQRHAHCFYLRCFFTSETFPYSRLPSAFCVASDIAFPYYSSILIPLSFCLLFFSLSCVFYLFPLLEYALVQWTLPTVYIRFIVKR